MATEIERKFTLKNDHWRPHVIASHVIRQGYLVTGLEPDESASVRVRITDNKATLNIKSAQLAVTRDEFEYEIARADADYMLTTLCQSPIIEKTRHIVPFAGHTWEIDVFAGENAGLILAEVELASEQEVLSLPEWVAEEVSSDARYYNVYLVTHPYNCW